MNIKKFEETVKELEIQVVNNLRGTVLVEGTGPRRLVTLRTKSMIYETHKLNKYIHGAFLSCDNYSIKAEDNEIVIVFGFEIQ